MPTQLRRYAVAEGELDRFVEWFAQIAPVRKKYGFTIEFAYADHERNEFVWAVSHPGDFDAATAEYHDSPERAAAFDGFDNPITDMTLSMVEDVL